MIPGEHAEHYRRYRMLAQLLDQAVRVPGTRVGLGLDFLLGLVPGAGDLAGTALASYGLWVAQRLGAPRSLLVRMAGNIAIDTIVGAVPVLGDLFDLAWKSNVRNLALLDRWLDEPVRTRRASRALVFALGIGLAIVAGVVLYAVGAFVVWAFRTLSG